MPVTGIKTLKMNFFSILKILKQKKIIVCWNYQNTKEKPETFKTAAEP